MSRRPLSPTFQKRSDGVYVALGNAGGANLRYEVQPGSSMGYAWALEAYCDGRNFMSGHFHSRQKAMGRAKRDFERRQLIKVV